MSKTTKRLIVIILALMVLTSPIHNLASVFSATPKKVCAAELSGWESSKGSWYYYQDGSPVTGWQKINGYWYYFASNGVMKTGWQKIGGNWYYFASTGVMQTGWLKLGVNWYYLNSSGVMQTGWQKISGSWYYLNSSGQMQTGWLKLGVNWYYLNSSGVMQTGWQKISGSWYYLNSSGQMQTGWLKLNGNWYYLESSGKMKIGWLKYNGYWYYFKSNGVMACNEYVDGYSFDASGHWTGSAAISRALLIGNQNYSSELPGCHNDMNSMAGMLGGLKNSFKITKYPDASASQMLNAIKSAFSGATESDVSLFFYSGHGLSSSGSSYHGSLCGVDGSYLTPSELASALSAVPGRVIVLLDSCFSGAVISTKDGKVDKSALDSYNQAVIDAFAAVNTTLSAKAGEMYGKSKFVVLTAAAYSETSSSLWYTSEGESSAFGVFTRALVEGCGSEYYTGNYTGSIPSDNNGDKGISVTEIYNYILNDQYVNYVDQTTQCYAANMSEILFKR